MTKTPRCPICRKPLNVKEPEHKPFCSRRCREVDLGRWFSEDYRLPAAETPNDDTDSE